MMLTQDQNPVTAQREALAHPDKTVNVEADANLRRYLSVVLKIFEHIKTQNPAALTELRRRARIRKEKAHNKAQFPRHPSYD